MIAEHTRASLNCFLRRVAISLIALMVLCTVLGLILSANMRPAIQALATSRIKAVAARAMNDAILECMDDSANFAELIEVMDNGERVYMLKADARKMNLLAADCALTAQERILEMGEQGISVPIGTVTGISFLSGKGPKLRVTFTPAGSVQSEFRSEFVSCGINQSLYRVNLRLTSSIKLVMPGVNDTISVYTEAAIAESIIVGEVPQVYTNVEDTEDMLNLIPTEVQ